MNAAAPQPTQEEFISSPARRIATMELQTIRSNIVQAIRAYRVDDLMSAAQAAGQHFLYANLSATQSKQEVLDGIAGPQPGFVVVLEQLPDNPRFDREAREQLLEVFRDAAEFWGERRIPFRCFYSFQ
jgi:hypothetical protein